MNVLIMPTTTMMMTIMGTVTMILTVAISTILEIFTKGDNN